MQAFVACLVAALCAGAMAYTQQEYCNVCSDHTACKYSGVSSKCTAGVFSNGLSDSDKTALVDIHNAYRNRVALGVESRGKPGPQPGSSNMNRLVWNNDLAEVAQRLTDQCIYGHDSCRNLPGMVVGQNLFLRSAWPCRSTHQGRNWTAPVDAWFSEIDLFDKSGVNSYQFNSQTGHYTQLVWGNTAQVGCGYTLFEENGWCKDYVACNYGPAGNYISQPMYKTGLARSACAAQRVADPRYPALC